MKQSDALAFLPIIKAWGEGKTIQTRLEYRFRDVGPDETCAFAELKNYRIKPETIKYRRYLKGGDGAGVYVDVYNDVLGKLSITELESWRYFIRWIDTEWQEQEV